MGATKREARESDFFVELPSVGVFRYGRRTYGDQLRIRAEQLKLAREVGDDDPDLALYAGTIAVHRVLCVEAPDGWEDLADVDLTAVGVERVFELMALLREKEDSFRASAEPKGKAARP